MRRIPKMVQAAALGLAMVAMVGANGSRVDRLGHEMVCMCGCNQILMECNHVGCPVSPVMISELQEQVDGGGADTAVLNWFAAKYGPIVLASPIRGGFDTVAWIVPISVFILATFGTGGMVWMWRRRTLQMADAASGYGCGGVLDEAPMPMGVDAEGMAMRDRIRRETEYR